MIPFLKDALPPNEFEAVDAWSTTFYPFQQEWLFDWRQLAANLKCRQIGGSHTFAGWGTLHGLFGEDTTMVSIRDQEARDLLEIAANHAGALCDLGSKWARVTKANTTEIRLASGAIIRSTTSTAAGRGSSGNILLDEFAYHENQEKVWDAALAATTHGYSARVNSTPNGVGDTWYQLCNDLGHDDADNPRGWRIYRTTIHDAIAQGMAIDLDDAWDRARHDPRVFDQLYCCKFLDGDLQYIPFELIKRATTEREVDTYAETFGGIDIGESRDRTVLLVIQGDPQAGYQVKHCESHARTDDVLIQKLIKEAFGLWGCTRVGIDQTGLGTFPAKKARREFGPKLEPIQFTSKSKEDMASRLYQSFADELLRLPNELPNGEAAQIREDIASIRRIVTPAGNVRFDAPRTAKGHADTAWALMIALSMTRASNVKRAYSEMMAKVRGV